MSVRQTLIMNFTTNKSSFDDVYNHLCSVDIDFVPPLSSTLSIDLYAEKLVSKANRCEVWIGNLLVGLIAYYNTGDGLFISNFSVIEEHRGTGVSRLLYRYYQTVTSDVHVTTLRTSIHNVRAQKFYESIGFSVLSRFNDEIEYSTLASSNLISEF